MKRILRHLRGSVTGRAVVAFGFIASLSFLVFVYGTLQEQEAARSIYRSRTNLILNLKSSYQDYETTMLSHMADPEHVVVSDAQTRYSMLEQRLRDAENTVIKPENKQALAAIRGEMKKISPQVFMQPTQATPGAMNSALMAMTAIRSIFLAYDMRLAARGAELDATQSIHSIAEGLMGFSAVALLLLIGRLLITQSESMQEMRVEKDTQLAAIETSRDGIVILDDAGKIIFMNRAFSLLHYLSNLGRKDAIGLAWADLYDDRGGAIVRDEILPTAREKGFWHGESNLVNARGQMFAAHLSLTALPEGGFIGTAHDTREKREREKETEQLRLQYYQAQKMESLGRLAGGIAHDFNNILAAISGYAEFLTQDLPPESQTHGFAERILIATNRAKSLIEQILTFSRTNDKGKSDLNLTEAVAEVISMLRASLPSGISIDTMDTGPSAHISANPTQISQALMNLCVNAQDSMGQRGRLNITLDIVDAAVLELPAAHMVDAYPEGNRTAPVFINSLGAGRTHMVVGHVVAGQKYARLSVGDSGSGIPRHVMEHMFEPFFTTKDVNKGTGLGLAAVHGIVVSHRGVLCVDTTLDKGSVFQMLFPLLDRDAVADAVEEEDTNTGPVSGRILVIDDHDDVRTTTCMMLQRGGYEVFDSKLPSEALDLIRDNPSHFDLVITDFSMPEMTGVEVAQVAATLAPDLPFILISGYAEAQHAEKIAAVPTIRDVIKKPVRLAELVKRARVVLAG